MERDIDRVLLASGLIIGIIVGGGLTLLFGSSGFLAAFVGGLIRIGERELQRRI